MGRAGKGGAAEVGGSKQIKDFLAEEFPSSLLMTWHYTVHPLSRPSFCNLF